LVAADVLNTWLNATLRPSKTRPPRELGKRLMLQALPGVFRAGEMLDWEAPTGGYLLTACFASGRAAGQGAVRGLARH